MSAEFEEFVEKRTKEFLEGQDLDSFVQLVPEENRAEFSAKLVSFTQALVEQSTATGLAIVIKMEDIEKVQSSILEKSTQTAKKIGLFREHNRRH